jgi:hypothetical protein
MPSDPSCDIEEVVSLREELSKEMLYHEFAGESELRELVHTHLIRWLIPLRSVHRFQKYANKLETWTTQALHVPKPPPSDEIVALDGIPWDQELPDGKDTYDYRGYLASRDGRPFDTDLLRCYRVARYLFRQVLSDQHFPFRDRVFTTFIQRYLADHVRNSRAKDDPGAQRYLEVLRGWLTNRNGVFRNARSFAAYQLGMCRDRDGRAALLRTLQDTSDDHEVRRYAALALGMLRARDAIPELINVYDQPGTSDKFRDALGYAILAAAGLLPEI